MSRSLGAEVSNQPLKIKNSKSQRPKDQALHEGGLWGKVESGKRKPESGGLVESDRKAVGFSTLPLLQHSLDSTGLHPRYVAVA